MGQYAVYRAIYSAGASKIRWTMLAAQRYALESRGLQTMLNIRQRDFIYMNDRLVMMSTQAALFAGEWNIYNTTCALRN